MTSDSASPGISAADAFVARHARLNFLFNVVDGGMFWFGLSMVSRYTVLPLLIERLAGDRWMQGLIPTILNTGWLLPGLFLAPIVANQWRRKPMLVAATLFERLPFLIIGAMLVAWPGAPAWMLLGGFFALWTVHSLAAGVAAIPWQDFIGRIIPRARWGLFFGAQTGFGGALGVGGAAIATYVLATQPFPQSVGYLALGCFAAMIVSFTFLLGTREPAIAPGPRQTIVGFWASIVPLLRRDVSFRTYLFSRAAISLSLTGHSFITAAAIERFALSDGDVGWYTAVLLGAQAVANVALGWLADRWGHRQVLVLATLVGVVAMVATIAAPATWWFVAIFVMIATAQAGYQICGLTLLLGFSPTTERPMYIGVANAVLAPLAISGPLACGWLAEATSYDVMFWVLVLIGIGGAALLGWRVRLPAHP